MTYEILKDLVSVVTKNKVKQIEILGNPDQDESRLSQLYTAIQNGKASSDEELAALFFKEGAKSAEYRKLRSKLIRQLVNSVFFIDSNQATYSDLAIAFYHCQRDYAAANLLISKGGQAAGIYFLNQVLEQTIKHEFTELTAEVTRILRKAYNDTTSDRANQERMTQLSREYEEKRRWEMEAYDYVSTVYMHYSSGRSINKEISIDTKAAYDRLFPKLGVVNTAKFYHYVYTLGVTYYFLINDCKGALDLCNTAIDELNKRSNVPTGFLRVYALQRIVCLTQLRIFDPVLFEIYSSFVLNFVAKERQDWIIIQGTFLHYRLYEGNYGEALRIYTEVIKHPSFSLLTGMHHEIWRVYEGYLQWLYTIGKVEATEDTSFLADFKGAKFENNFVVFNKERIGMNIPIMLLPILFNVIEHRTIETHRTLDALEKYRKRYLDIDINVRSSSFMRILFAMIDLPFNTKSAEKRIQSCLDALKNNPIEIAGQSFAIEIIPYEQIWSMIKEKLGAKLYAPMSN